MKKIENNAEHIAKQMCTEQKSKKEKKEVVSNVNTHECIYGADNKPITTVYHGF